LKSKIALYIGSGGRYFCQKLTEFNYTGLAFESYAKAYRWLDHRHSNDQTIPDVIICDSYIKGEKFSNFLLSINSRKEFEQLTVIIVSSKPSKDEKMEAITSGADEYFETNLNVENLQFRLNFLTDFKKNKFEQEEKHNLDTESLIDLDTKSEKGNIKPWKRAFDVLFSSILILILSPFFLLVAALIKITSPGPVFYISKRAGAGYKIFNFYKFRTMKVGADEKLHELSERNQYNNNGHEKAFVKISNDPRITPIGHFLRKTSLDETPQLFNVLKGDMSLVGNRPLPLYEASLLTKDKSAERFLAPAGLTGLWQVTKRGKEEMSGDERLELDILYANKYSFWFDLKIILKTLPAMIQKEKV